VKKAPVAQNSYSSKNSSNRAVRKQWEDAIETSSRTVSLSRLVENHFCDVDFNQLMTIVPFLEHDLHMVMARFHFIVSSQF